MKTNKSVTRKVTHFFDDPIRIVILSESAAADEPKGEDESVPPAGAAPFTPSVKGA
jgi:hypothetical protein